MFYDGASKTVVGCNSDLKHPEFIGLILGPARGLTDTGAQQPVVGASAALRSTSQTARFGARGRDTVQHDCDLWWNWHGQGCASSGFPCWNRECERSDAIPGARGAHVGRWKTRVHPPLTPITIMRQLGANIRMKDSGDVLEIEDDHGTTHTEKLVRERSGHVHN